jgi:hypothetical protein
LFSDPLPSIGSPVFVLVRFRGNVLTDSLPSNGSICLNLINFHLEIVVTVNDEAVILTDYSIRYKFDFHFWLA